MISESDGQMMWGVRVISRVANNVWTCLRPKTSMDCWSVRYKFHCIQGGLPEQTMRFV